VRILSCVFQVRFQFCLMRDAKFARDLWVGRGRGEEVYKCPFPVRLHVSWLTKSVSIYHPSLKGIVLNWKCVNVKTLLHKAALMQRQSRYRIVSCRVAQTQKIVRHYLYPCTKAFYVLSVILASPNGIDASFRSGLFMRLPYKEDLYGRSIWKRIDIEQTSTRRDRGHDECSKTSELGNPGAMRKRRFPEASQHGCGLTGHTSRAVTCRQMFR